MDESPFLLIAVIVLIGFAYLLWLGVSGFVAFLIVMGIILSPAILALYLQVFDKK